MSKIIYYFSGTGNSYRVAAGIAEKIGTDTTMINIAETVKRKQPAAPAAVVGIVFPLYYFGLPVIVEEFIRKLTISANSYVFIVITRGVNFAGGARRQIRELLDEKGVRLQLFRYLTMGNNYPFHGFNGSEQQVKQLKNRCAEQKIADIAAMSAARKCSRRYSILDYRPFSSITFYLPGYGYRYFREHVYNNDRYFIVDRKRCNGCRKCERVCPTGNISAEDGVVWQHRNCQLCLACFNGCPQNAVQYIDNRNKINTEEKRQYWNFPKRKRSDDGSKK